MQGAAHLKSQLFAKGEERQVEVNQRHLIDKILARYSSEFTLFRELIQNANDAGATHIEIVLTSPTYCPPSTSPATDSASTTTASATAGAVPESSASSAASSILSLFKFGLWNAGLALETEKDEEMNGSDGGKKKQTKRADDHALQFGSCDATEIKIQNNGRAFTEEDWTRIRKIAEGNPNSDACGMFGVGFYSVFAICEQPIIKSGDDCLIFHWRGDMLVTTRAKVEDTTEDAGVAGEEEEDAERKAAATAAAEAAKRRDWVAFVLETREVMPFDLDLLSRFVVKSVSFTTNVQSISLIVNDIKLLQVHTNVDKRSTEAREKETEEVAVPRVTKEDVKRRQKEHGYMSIASIKAQRMTVKVDRYPFTKPLFVKMRLLNAQVEVHWEFYPEYLENMKRILKKTPPSRTSILLLYNFDDDDNEADRLKALDSQSDPTASSSSTSTPGSGLSFWSRMVTRGPSSSTPAQQLIDDGLGGQARKVDDLVVDLFPCPNNGHIFIGFSTQQTTGTGFHLAAQLIPTVERENIDFQDVYISNWNCNLLAAAGQVSRLYYDHIMKKIESTRIQPEQEQTLEREIVNLLSAHSFVQSHPSEKVVRLLNQYFFVHPLQYANVTPLAQQQRIPPTLFFIPSTAGILTCDKVRLPYLDMEDFLIQRGSGTTSTAIVPKSLLHKCDRFFNHLKARSMVREISLDDLLDELKRRELSLDELAQVVKWFSKPQVEHALFVNQRKNVLKLLSSLTVVVRETKEQEVIEPSGDGAPASTAVAVSFRPVRQNLGEVQFFVGASKAMRGLPLPPATLDPFISASLSAVLHKNLLLKRFGWRELTAWDWWGHIRNNLHLLTAPGGTDVLKHIAEFFPHLPEGNKNEVVAVLRQVACIPIEPRQDQAPSAATTAAAASATTTTATTAFRRPEEVYFPSVRLFADIDHVRADIIRHDTKPFLKALGVRDTVDLKLVLGRLEQLRWNVRDLVDYLTKQQPSFTPADWNLLRNSAFLPAVAYKRKAATASASADDSTTPGPEAAPAEGGVTAVGAPVAHRRRAAADVFATEFEEMRDNIPRKASELFFPADEMKALGFIVLDWSPKAADHQQQQPQQLDPKSKQAQLLKKIGLLDKPNLLSLVQLASSYPYDGADEHSEGEQMREKILGYMEANAEELLRAQPPGFNVRDIEMRFLPARVRTAQARSQQPPEGGAQPQPQAEYGRLLCDPKRCFLNDSPFGFPVVEERWRGLAKKLNTAADPPLTSIINMIVKAPPADQKSGEEVFEYLYSRLQEFTREDRRTLLATPFIPLTYGRPTVRMSATHEVFITDSFQLLRNGERRDEQRKQITAKLAKTRQAIQDLEAKKGAAPTPDDKLRAKLARQDPKASAAQFSQQQHYLFQLKTLQTEESKALKELKRLEAEAEKERRDRAPPAVAGASPSAAAAATAVAAAKRSAFDVFDNLLEFVDFGERGNQFLRSCGVEEYPTPEQFANNIMRHHQRYLAKNGVARYLRLLSLFAAAFPHIAPPPPPPTATTATPAASSSSSALLNQLRQCPFCVALHYTDDDDRGGGGGGSGSGGKKGGKVEEEEEEEEEEKVREETALMKKASECYLIDNERFAKLFNPPRIPHGSGDAAFSSSALEKMYESLGAKWITSDVKTSCQREGELRATPKAKKLKRLLTDRKPLLVNNMNGQRRKNLRSNAEDVLSKLQVFAVAKIERVLTFKHQRVTEEASVAVMNHENGKLALFIVEAMELDYFDIGTELVGLLYRKSVHDDALLTAMLLQTPLPTLRKRGWPVDRLLQKEDGGGAGALVYHGAAQPRELQLQPTVPPVVGKGGSGEDRQLTSAPPLSQPPKADSQSTKRPSGFFQSLWDAIAAPPAAAPPVRPKPTTATTTTSAPAPLQMETTGGRRAIAAPADPRQVPAVQTAGGAEIVSRVKHEADDQIDAQRMYQQMESEAKRALQGVSQGASQVIHQQPSERNEVNYFCEVLPEQTLVNVDQVHGITLYLEEGSTLSTEHVQGAQVMAQVLLQLAGVFGIPANSLHMWIGYKGRRIAFNRGNSLYFNLTVFIDLRFRTRSECMRYWYMVMCHELAHNNVAAHNEEHESLLSWLAFRHMEALNALLLSGAQQRP